MDLQGQEINNECNFTTSDESNVNTFIKTLHSHSQVAIICWVNAVCLQPYSCSRPDKSGDSFWHDVNSAHAPELSDKLQIWISPTNHCSCDRHLNATITHTHTHCIGNDACTFHYFARLGKPFTPFRLILDELFRHLIYLQIKSIHLIPLYFADPFLCSIHSANDADQGLLWAPVTGAHLLNIYPLPLNNFFSDFKKKMEWRISLLNHQCPPVHCFSTTSFSKRFTSVCKAWNAIKNAMSSLC